MKNHNLRLTFGSHELGLIARALREYSDACLLDAEMAVGRDEVRRRSHLQNLRDARTLLEEIEQRAA